MKYLNYVLIAIFTLTFFSCHKDLIEEAEMVGTWKCVEIEEKGEIPPLQDIVFDFKADSTYHLHDNDLNAGQKGQWYTMEDKLYTHPEGGKLMAVKLGRSGNDTLRFYQNRGGFPVVWTMVRQ